MTKMEMVKAIEELQELETFMDEIKACFLQVLFAEKCKKFL